MPNKDTGKLFIVATPIGNPEDITLRAIKILNSVDAILCEESKQGSITLKSIGVKARELIPVNEHTEEEAIPLIVERIFIKNQQLALISDCGTPVFSDPGYRLIQQLSEMSVPIIPIPGPSSLMAALSILTIDMSQFIFGGFLPRDSDSRRNQLMNLKRARLPIVLMDTPYRLVTLLEELQKVFGANHMITVACDLTLSSEKIYCDTVSNVIKHLTKKKSEFILIVHR